MTRRAIAVPLCVLVAATALSGCFFPYDDGGYDRGYRDGYHEHDRGHGEWRDHRDHEGERR
ncbi:hypothetical protein GMSM_09410 [Geomonas sp. Red276]